MTGALGREFEFSERHFNRLRAFVTAQTGIVLSDAKKDMVYGRLSKRIRKQFAGSFDAFCDAIDAGNNEEHEFLINAITTNLTAFFREKHHFDYLKHKVIPDLLRHNQASKKIRIWSAGCSTGEEPYSIAICLREAVPDLEDWDIKILATDLDANVVAHGKQGIYAAERISALPEAMSKKWFRHGTGQNKGLVKVRQSLKQLVTFKQLNLLHSWPMKGCFDIIFCRNVVIYFDKQTQARLFRRYADILVPNGYLFIGHSESLYKVTDRFISLGHTIYRQLPI
ncbi:CheR family methyltransferase [Methylophaga sp. OBS4]|uniref:CheR family methyltransferase n=1 Tax=Methylophaga sp. OBS4 TaxID=2991935 RepID=UPI002255DDBE|nr:protein-glutamate O-methyltransferase CheR [Methylophaga sp. OBS4]MCX4187391.1 protein-glutamate O-methyltransferase CheR [Methylophaga sp. OBS4]